MKTDTAVKNAALSSAILILSRLIKLKGHILTRHFCRTPIEPFTVAGTTQVPVIALINKPIAATEQILAEHVL